MKLLYRSLIAIVGFCSTLLSAYAIAQSGVGAAPKGDAKVVVSRIIKHNFPSCRTVSNAVRAPDGSIRAVCDMSNYMVFTFFKAKEGKTSEIAVNQGGCAHSVDSHARLTVVHSSITCNRFALWAAVHSDEVCLTL